MRRSLCPQRGWYHPVDGCTYTLGGETGFPASGALARFIAGDDVVRIEWIEIDGFGHFAGRTFGPLARGITIIHGPNEAGKSTLHAFIRAILFGFPAPDAPEWIPAPAGELHGGRLVLRDGAGARIVVERHRDRCGGAARVTCEGGPDGGEEALRELLGNIGSDAYRSIFAFGVDDLCALDPCLLGALSGSDLVPGDRQLHRPKDNGPPVAEILRELEALDRELFIARLPGDSDLRDRRAEVARQIAAAERKLAALDDLGRRLEQIERERDAARARVEEAQGELAGVEASIERLRAASPAATEDGVARDARRLRMQIDELRETWTRLQATRRMTEVYEQTVARQHIPREPVFLGLLAAGALVPLAIGLIIGQPVVVAIGVGSALLGALMLVLAVIARSRFDTAQAQARFQLEITQRDAETRYVHAALVAGIDAEDVHAGIERLTTELAGLEAARNTRDELRALEAERAFLRARLKRAAAELGAAESALDEARAAWPLLAGELGIAAGQDLATARAAIEQARDQLLVERGRLDERIEQCEADRQYDDQRLRRETLLAALRERAGEWTGGLAVDRLRRDAPSGAENGGRPVALRKASAVLEAMTFGAYHRLERAGGSGELLAVARDGSRTPVDRLSRGAREQAYLALRIGLIQAVGAQVRPLPVLIDDVLANFDPERATEALRVLGKLAGAHQILLFTCHPVTAALARFVDPAAGALALGARRVAGLDPVWLEND